MAFPEKSDESTLVGRQRVIASLLIFGVFSRSLATKVFDAAFVIPVAERRVAGMGEAVVQNLTVLELMGRFFQSFVTLISFLERLTIKSLTN